MTLCGWSAKQTIPLSVLARNQTRAWARDLRHDRKWVREDQWGVGQRNSEKAVGDGRRRGAVGSRHRTAEETNEHEIAPRSKWGKTCQDELAFLVALWKFREGCTSVLVYICKGMQRVTTQPSCTWVDPSLNVRLFFVLSSHSLDCISCGHREMCDTPIGKKLMYSGAEGVLSHVCFNFFYG